MKKRLRVTLIITLALAVTLTSAFFLYVSDYYRADDVAVAALAGSGNIRSEGGMIILSPAAPGDTALIFYPGGKVEYTAYIPILQKLTQKGITCVLVQMPFNLAVLDINAADRVYDKLPEIKTWYIGGHSLGGVMASDYAARHKADIAGVILLGAYIYGDVSPENALTIYGTQDIQLDKSKITYTENVHVIEGGNHAHFGNYGEQKGDGTATIAAEEQQGIAVLAIAEFIHAPR